MLRQLTRYYKEKRIAPFDFRCQHWQDCSNGNQNITQARGAFVGTAYEKGLLPRLLFLSLDPGCSDSQPNKRTVEFVRYSEEKNCKVDSLPKQRHWYRIHELATILLKKFMHELKIEDSHLYFAHANSVKCSMNHSNHKQAAPRVFRNCREYIAGEVKILKPDILVTQGKWAQIAVEESFDVSDASNSEPCSYKMVQIGERQTIWIHTFHPSNYGKFNKQRRECFEAWAELIYKIIK
jgi:hypothetical protein